MNKLSKMSVGVLAFLLLGNLLVTGAREVLAEGMASGIASGIASATSEDGNPACWVAVGNKIYFVEKDDTTILKVKASGAL